MHSSVVCGMKKKPPMVESLLGKYGLEIERKMVFERCEEEFQITRNCKFGFALEKGLQNGLFIHAHYQPCCPAPLT